MNSNGGMQEIVGSSKLVGGWGQPPGLERLLVLSGFGDNIKVVSGCCGAVCGLCPY